MRKLIIFILLNMLILSVWTQNESTIFTYEKFITIVKQHHPIAYQAGLKLETGKAKITKAKGGFDPKIQGHLSQKYFNGTQYYSYLNSGLKIPTWFGVSFQGGYNNTGGTYLNSESKTPNTGIWYAGITLNLGKGLLIDQRRAELKQANIYMNSTEIEKRLILNQLIFDASTSYWNWYKAYNKVEIYKEAVLNAQTRYNGIKSSADLGEKASIDTLKALIQVKNRALKLEQSVLDYTNKKAMLETYLWQDGFVPLILDSTMTPKLYSSSKVIQPNHISTIEIENLINKHPEMIYYQYDIDILKIDYRLKKESLKPLIQLKYNNLSTPTPPNFIGDYSLNNYNWGASISYPIFTRKERGSLQLSEIKIKESESQLTSKKAAIKYKLVSSYNTWISTVSQVQIYAQTITYYQTLFESESTLFNIGESALFMVNYREQELIKAQIKMIELVYLNKLSKVNWNYQTVDF